MQIVEKKSRARRPAREIVDPFPVIDLYRGGCV
jgi:hypothetical protein